MPYKDVEKRRDKAREDYAKKCQDPEERERLLAQKREASRRWRERTKNEDPEKWEIIKQEQRERARQKRTELSSDPEWHAADKEKRRERYCARRNPEEIQKVRRANRERYVRLKEEDPKKFEEQKRKNAASQERIRSKRIQMINGYKAECGCYHCGETNPVVLEFDHLDPNSITARVSAMATWDPRKLWDEIRKCQVLCRNCHRVKTVDCGEHKKGKKTMVTATFWIRWSGQSRL